MSGKTTLAHKLANKAKNDGNGVLVLDPLLDPEWMKHGAQFLTDDPVEFLAIAKKNKSCHLFIDEAGNYCGQYAKETWWLATQARHWGHKSYFISQRANMVAKNIRDNCKDLFCFRISPSDAKLLADDFCFRDLENAPQLMQGEFFYAPRYGEIKKLSAFEKTA